MVYVVHFIFFPIAYPIAKVLDYVLGHDEGITVYNRSEIATMMNIQHEEVWYHCAIVSLFAGTTFSTSVARCWMESACASSKALEPNPQPSALDTLYPYPLPRAAPTPHQPFYLLLSPNPTLLFDPNPFTLLYLPSSTLSHPLSFPLPSPLLSSPNGTHVLQGNKGKSLTGGPLHSEEMSIIDGALKFRWENKGQ